MKNIGQMMKQAQQVQAKMNEMQMALTHVEMTGASGGGMVCVTLSGKGDCRKVSIDKDLMNPAEGEVLEDLIVAAFADAKGKVEAYVQEEMAKLTGGLNLPAGLKLPF
ncbi:MAG: YbaB/EbfC family nucleoid-associated protein [Alphaproteobacteria bacterium]|nr:YbaB/EbfC family nucleoid-associated protein [Alphaproteobacteria bacterium]